MCFGLISRPTPQRRLVDDSGGFTGHFRRSFPTKNFVERSLGRQESNLARHSFRDNGHGEFIAAFAEDSEKTHVKGCEFVLNLSQVNKNPTDIVVTTNGGYPLVQIIYQSVKGMIAAEVNCKVGGVIIMVAGLSDEPAKTSGRICVRSLQ